MQLIKHTNKGTQPGFETQGRRNQNSKTRLSVAPQKRLIQRRIQDFPERKKKIIGPTEGRVQNLSMKICHCNVLLKKLNRFTNFRVFSQTTVAVTSVRSTLTETAARTSSTCAPRTRRSTRQTSAPTRPSCSTPRETHRSIPTGSFSMR